MRLHGVGERDLDNVSVPFFSLSFLAGSVKEGSDFSGDVSHGWLFLAYGVSLTLDVVPYWPNFTA